MSKLTNTPFVRRTRPPMKQTSLVTLARIVRAQDEKIRVLETRLRFLEDGGISTKSITDGKA